jgi:hypothetical protein
MESRRPFQTPIAESRFGPSLRRILTFERASITSSAWHAPTTSNPGCRAAKASPKRFDGDAMRAIFASLTPGSMVTQFMSMQGVAITIIGQVSQYIPASLLPLDGEFQPSPTFWKNGVHTERTRMVFPWYDCANAASNVPDVERCCCRQYIEPGQRRHPVRLGLHWRDDLGLARDPPSPLRGKSRRLRDHRRLHGQSQSPRAWRLQGVHPDQMRHFQGEEE